MSAYSNCFVKTRMLLGVLIFSGLMIVGCGGFLSDDEDDGGNEPPLVPELPSGSLHTWWHDNHELNAETPVADENVRRSTFYDVRVATSADPQDLQDSYVYMTLPRSGREKWGYSKHDGAEFASQANLTMSWSSFLYSEDVWVEVRLRDDHVLESVDEIRVLPSTLGFEKELVDNHAVRIRVPHSEVGYKFSVEFDHQLMTSYNDDVGGTGNLTEDPSGLEVHTEPRNALLIFAQPMLTDAEVQALIPDPNKVSVYFPEEGEINLNSVRESAIYFRPGTYYMPWNYHAYVHGNVDWIYLAPGAYVKGAFEFRGDKVDYKLTGFGVLSGEKYVYEPDKRNGYANLHPGYTDCHGDCIKMLQTWSSNHPQTLTVHGVTINETPYHTFVTYGNLDTYTVNINHLKQMGSWYWQTDGFEIYRGGSFKNSFVHSNDDVIKIYHSDANAENVVVWKGENGPVIQFGWGPRNIENVHVKDVHVIHNRMYWKDQKHNTCIINSARHWIDVDSYETADTETYINGITLENIHSEGKNLCAMRMFAMSNWQNIHIKGLTIDAWSDLPAESQYSLFRLVSDEHGNPVSVAEGDNGLLIENYVVNGQPVNKADDSWNADSIGRLNFDVELWDNWNAISANGGDCEPQSITFPSIGNQIPGTSFEVSVSATSGLPVALSVTHGDAIVDGTWITLGESVGRVILVAEQEGDGFYCPAVLSREFYTEGRWIGASFADWWPANLPMQWNTGDHVYERLVTLEAGDHALKFGNTSDWSGTTWGNAFGLSGTVTDATGDVPNLVFEVATSGNYWIRLDPETLEYSITLD